VEKVGPIIYRYHQVHNSLPGVFQSQSYQRYPQGESRIDKWNMAAH